MRKIPKSSRSAPSLKVATNDTTIGALTRPREQRTENSEQSARQARDGQNRCASGVSRRPICPICPTAMPETARIRKPPITPIGADWGPAPAGRTARMDWKSQRTRRTQSTAQEAGRACAQGARPARGACRGMAGFARHALVLGSPPAQLRPIGPIRPICPTAMSFWHVADVPGVQGELLPAGAWGSAPHLPIS